MESVDSLEGLDIELRSAPDVLESRAYKHNLLVLRRHMDEFTEGTSSLRLVEFLLACRNLADCLKASATILGFLQVAEYWAEESQTFDAELKREEGQLSTPPDTPNETRVMKALRFSPSLYAETKRISRDVLGCTLISYIEEAIREKNARTLSDPELAAELERRRAFDDARARKNHLLRPAPRNLKP